MNNVAFSQMKPQFPLNSTADITVDPGMQLTAVEPFTESLYYEHTIDMIDMIDTILRPSFTSIIERKCESMTYSQRSSHPAAASDYTYLEYQIGIAAEELAKAIEAQDEARAEAIREQISDLEEELALLED